MCRELDTLRWRAAAKGREGGWEEKGLCMCLNIVNLCSCCVDTAKSQFLKYVEACVHHGTGVLAMGLMVYVHITKECTVAVL